MSKDFVQNNAKDLITSLGRQTAHFLYPNEIDFGKLKPGETGSQDMTLSNQGAVDLNIRAMVAGDGLFVENTKVDEQAWPTYRTDLNKGQQTGAEVSLSVPGNYVGSGVKSGELIFWARAK